MLKLNFVVFAAVIFSSSLASAGAFVEPLIGYEISTSTASPVATDYENRGVVLGSRFGWVFEEISVHGEYLTSRFDQKKKSTGEVSKADTSDLGVGLQYQPLSWLKVSGTYLFSSHINDGFSQYFKGNGSRFGVSYLPLPWLAINLDMINAKYTLDSLSLDRSGYMFGVSFPLM